MPAEHITHDEMKTLPYIIAVDFDGTLVEDKYPSIGEPSDVVVMATKYAKSKGHKVILWTCRDGMRLKEAVDFCKNELELEFDAVNENIKETREMFNNDTRKVYANEYWDDKSTPLNKLIHIMQDTAERFRSRINASRESHSQLNLEVSEQFTEMRG